MLQALLHKGLQEEGVTMIEPVIKEFVLIVLSLGTTKIVVFNGIMKNREAAAQGRGGDCTGHGGGMGWLQQPHG